MSIPTEKNDIDDIEVEIEENEEQLENIIKEADDTPVEDRGKSPMPEEIVQELEADELEEYSGKVKQRLKQMKKVWHDERRAKEEVERQQAEALGFTKHLLAENRQLKSRYAYGEKTLVETYKGAAELELGNAKRAYKEAYDSGDSDKVVEAQQALNEANTKIARANSYTPALQEEENAVYNREAPETPDAKTLAWQKRNSWYGDKKEPEMTALALGYHQKLEHERGKQYVGTDDYWNDIDSVMRQRFPEKFEETTSGRGGKPTSRTVTKPASVVASASRSTGSNRIVLKRSQVTLAKKLGISPEEYAKEALKLENQNG